MTLARKASLTLAILLSASTIVAAHAGASLDHRQTTGRSAAAALGIAKVPLDARANVIRDVQRVPETDGLSRNDEDCNYGCLDH